MNITEYNYLKILEIDHNGYYDFSDSSVRLLHQLKNNKNLTKKDKIKIIKNFEKYQLGEEYGGGEPCNNTDCYRYYKKDIHAKINKKWKHSLNNVYYLCPDCADNNVDNNVDNNDYNNDNNDYNNDDNDYNNYDNNADNADNNYDDYEN